MVENGASLPHELETVSVYSQLVRSSDDLLVGVDNYKTWCERAVGAWLPYVNPVAAGVLIVPQSGRGAGVPVRLLVKPAGELEQRIVNDIISEFWRRPTSKTTVTKVPNLSPQADLVFVATPIAQWFDPPIGFFWALTSRLAVKPVQIYMEYAAHLIALAIRMTKSTHTVNLLSQAIWSEQASTRTKASEAAQGCLQALACKAIIMWESNFKAKPPMLTKLVVVGDVPATLPVDMQIGTGVAGIAALDNKVIIIEDLLDEAELVSKGIRGVRHPEIVLNQKWRSAIVAPLDIGGQVAGVLAAYAERVRAFSELDKNILLAFAQRLAAGYTHVARIEQLTEMERRLELEAAAIETGILAIEHVHDAHNSLGVAQAYIGLIRGEFKRRPESHIYKHAQAVSKNIDSALKLIKILRDGADITKVTLANHRLKKTLDEVVDQVQEEANRARVTIRCNCPEDLKFSYDKWQISRVFKNFLDNSLFFLQGVHRRELQIDIVVKLEGDFVRISFWDNGPGISPEDRPHIFDYFFTRKGEPKGMGFGLGIAKRIVERNHGGRIGVRSNWGEDAEFVVYLPYRS